MVGNVLLCIVSFALGGLFTMVMLRRDLFKVHPVNKIEEQMISALIERQGGGDDLVGIIAESGFNSDLPFGCLGCDKFDMGRGQENC